MVKESIELSGAPMYGPYTPGVKSNGTVWLSGQIDVQAGEDILSQTQGALNKIDSLLANAGLSKHNLCFVQVLLADMEFYAPMNDVYGKWVADMEIKPARAAFAVAGLPADALVEIVVQGTY